MRRKLRTINRISIAIVLAMLMVPAIADDQSEELIKGKTIAMNRSAGNCASCHFLDDAELPGNSGPPLIQMKLRFPDRQVLRKQIWDASIANPETVMPPYGRHMILTKEELDLLVDYIHSL